MSALIPHGAYRTAYKAQQATVLYNLLLAHSIVRRVTGFRMDMNSSAVETARARYWRLLEADYRNVEAGYYPRSLLFSFPMSDYARVVPKLLRDLPRTVRRAKRKDYKDLPTHIDLQHYPAYFRRNFHWQTDGYFSDLSAQLYDIGVEVLFLGAADIMRRQVIPPIIRGLDKSVTRPRVLDVACGTGRTLRQLSAALPQAKLYGLDLSPYYISAARDLLRSQSPETSLVAENAEQMPFRDNYFDAVSSVYLFHELPKNARRNVYREMFRVLKPGGTLVIEDSAQYQEADEVAFFLEQFAKEFHEPFYGDYLKDDIAAALPEVGFEVQSADPCFVSKIVVAKKPKFEN